MGILEQCRQAEERQRFIDYKKRSLNRNAELMERAAAYYFSSECEKDIQRLIDGEYFIAPPNRILLRKRYKSKFRTVYSYAERDRFILMLISHVLHDYDHIFPDCLYSFRRKRSGKQFITKIKQLKNRENMYVLKTDFSAFGETINLDILYKKLEEIFSDDPGFLNFLHHFLYDSRYIRDGELRDDERFLKAGSALTNFCENVYAMDIDRWMNSQARLYGRYGDDIVAFFDTREDAERCFAELTERIEALGLKFNKKKTGICEPGEEVEVLGVSVMGEHIDIASSSVGKISYISHKIAEKILIQRRKEKRTHEWAVQQFINYINRKFFRPTTQRHELNWTQWAFPIVTRPDSLHAIDKELQDCLRYLATGKTSDSKYRMKYSTLQAMGYKNLVHYFYHQDKLYREWETAEGGK